jgi:hypothetical protein
MLVKQAASATFFLILVMSFFDVVGGFTLGLRSRRRKVIVEHVEPTAETIAPAAERVEPLPEHAAHTPS